jgi:pSer/pThr/pTyr-binding forkhead associated (FHA) protein
MEYSPKKINMVLYLLEEKDIKVPSQKWEIVPNKLYIIGRSKKEADIALDDKLLSRKHAELTFYDDDKIKIRDLGSRNGTYLNKNRIEPLKDIYFTIKDTLSFGETNNEIIFFDNNNEKRQRDSYNEKKSDSKDKMENRSYTNRYDNDKDNYDKERYTNKYKETDKYKNEKSDNYTNKNRSNRSNRSNKSESKSRGRRSRSRDQYREESKNYSNKMKSVGNHNEIDNDYSFDRYSKEIDRKIEYQRRMMMEQNIDREEGRNSMFRRSQRYNNNENEDNGSNVNQGDIGFIKSYVSGYLLLNIKL